MLDQLGIAEASAKPSDEMHSSVLQTNLEVPHHRRFNCAGERLATLGMGRAHPARVPREIALRDEGLHRFLNRDRWGGKGCGRDAGEALGDTAGQDKIPQP